MTFYMLSKPEILEQNIMVWLGDTPVADVDTIIDNVRGYR